MSEKKDRREWEEKRWRDSESRGERIVRDRVKGEKRGR